MFLTRGNTCAIIEQGRLLATGKVADILAQAAGTAPGAYTPQEVRRVHDAWLIDVTVPPCLVTGCVRPRWR